MQPRVFVVQPVPPVAIDILSKVAQVTVYPYMDRQISVDDLAGAAQRADYIFAMHETTVTEQVFAANPNLKGIAIGGRHSDTIDFKAAAKYGIPILTAAGLADGGAPMQYGGVARATADLAVGLILSLAYRIVDADRYVRTTGFRQEQTMALMGIGCPGKSVGLIGLGRVARFMPAPLNALGMQVVYTKRTRLDAEDEAKLGVGWVADMDEILSTCDFVSVQCSYNPSTHLLIGARELALMKPTAYFINTARGRIVDQEALLKVLQDDAIAGAGLEVFWHEPPVTHDPHVPPEFLKLDNVILTPHNGGATWDVRGEMCSRIARVIAAAIAGNLPESAYFTP
jgi:glyoxylate reductase